MFVVDEIHVVDVVDVLRVVDGEDLERFGRLGRSTNENTDVVPERIYKRMERLLSFHFSQQVWLCTYARVKLILIGMAWSYGTFRLINQFLLQSSHRAISRSNEFETG